MFRQNERFHSQTLQNMQLGTMLLIYEGILTPTRLAISAFSGSN